MDMNWQVMLQKAGAVSFEKYAEALAGNGTVPHCADLSNAQIQALSRKLLLLPREGILLLFCRYCFRLSPEDTETFFGLKNARGRFRFYRQLLSLSMGLEGTRRLISDDALSKACHMAMQEYLRKELASDTAGEHPGRRISFHRVLRGAAVAAVTAALLFSTSLVASAQFRDRVAAWAVRVFEKFSVFEVQGDTAAALPDLKSYHPSYLPVGAKLLETVELPELMGYKYAVADSDTLNIWFTRSDIRVYLDTENIPIEPLNLNGITGYCFKKDGMQYVCLEQDCCFLSVYGSLDLDELMKIAAGITRDASD